MDPSSEPDSVRPDTDKTLTDLARGKSERVALGKNPYGTIVRIILFVLLFIAIFGSVFYFAQQ